MKSVSDTMDELDEDAFVGDYMEVSSDMVRQEQE